MGSSYKILFEYDELIYWQLYPKKWKGNGCAMQKMIDSHTHIGTYDSWVCPIDALKYFMDSHGVKYAVTADLSGNAEGARSTLKAIEQAKKFGNTFKILVWINPACKNDLEAAEEIITRYPSWIAGLKIHPRAARIRLDDDRYGPYMELCWRYNIPFVSHTEKDSFSNIEYLAKWAEAYPEINFVAVHMELFTDHKEAIQLISQLPNLYGDTTLVSAQDVSYTIEKCGADKILFGSDAPVMGTSSYDTLEELKRTLPDRFSKEAVDQVFFQNSKRIFHLDSII